MIANLFIDKHSFECSEDDILRVKHMLVSFCDMVLFASDPDQVGSNDFYINKNYFLNTVIFEDITVADLLYCSSEKVRTLIGNDVSLQFMSIFKRLKKLECENPIVRLPWATKERSYAVCVMKHRSDLPVGCQIVGSIRDLGKFRCRHHINFPDSDGYFDEADRYMMGLRLHPNIRHEYKKVFDTHKEKIDKCLWTIDESYIEYQKNFKGSRVNCVSSFARDFGLYEGGSYEGSKKLKKGKLRFEGRDEGVYCEPHLKMNTDDSGNKGYCRIYFEEPGSEHTRVYIGYICKHK